MRKLTKIIATIGPASDTPEIIEELINLGVDIFRFNFKHSDLAWHKERLQRVNDASTKLNANIATLLDLQGPEIRLVLNNDKIDITIDEKILLSKEISNTKEKVISFTNPDVIDLLKIDQKVLVDDGIFEFGVLKENGKTYLLAKTSGTILNKKAVNIMGLDFDFPAIHENDRQGLKLAKEKNVSFIALSFVRNENDLKILKQEMEKIGLDAKIIAKIETQKAILNIDKIIKQADAIMIARGDLGVELPQEEVPFYQKEIIKKCIQAGVPVITATQMLESMTQKPTPTRAEVSDVANAIYDFTDAIMLSAETASGKFPKEAVSTMTKIAIFNEDKNRILDIRNLFEYELLDQSQMVCDSAFNLYKALKTKKEKIKGFIAFTHTGKTARMLARYRPHVPIFAFCPSESLTRQMTISYGVYPVFQKTLKQKSEIVKEDIKDALNLLIENDLAVKKDTFIVLHGDYWTSNSGTSTIRLITI